MKDCLLLSNINAVSYKVFFPLLKDNKIRAGYTFNKDVSFTTPEGIEKKMIGICWYTTFSVKQKPLILTKTYNPDDYPKYDNYDAINVDKIKNIPMDYDGVMGVPVTILGYDLNDIQIIGCADADITPEGWKGMSDEFVKLYYKQGNTGTYKEGNILTHYIKDGVAYIPYKRILIKVS